MHCVLTPNESNKRNLLPGIKLLAGTPGCAYVCVRHMSSQQATLAQPSCMTSDQDAPLNLSACRRVVWRRSATELP